MHSNFKRSEHILIYPNESLLICVTYKRIGVSELFDGNHFPRGLLNGFQHNAIPTIVYCKYQIMMSGPESLYAGMRLTPVR